MQKKHVQPSLQVANILIQIKISDLYDVPGSQKFGLIFIVK